MSLYKRISFFSNLSENLVDCTKQYLTLSDRKNLNKLLCHSIDNKLLEIIDPLFKDTDECLFPGEKQPKLIKLFIKQCQSDISLFLYELLSDYREKFGYSDERSKYCIIIALDYLHFFDRNRTQDERILKSTAKKPSIFNTNNFSIYYHLYDYDSHLSSLKNDETMKKCREIINCMKDFFMNRSSFVIGKEKFTPHNLKYLNSLEINFEYSYAVHYGLNKNIEENLNVFKNSSLKHLSFTNFDESDMNTIAKCLDIIPTEQLSSMSFQLNSISGTNDLKIENFLRSLCNIIIRAHHLQTLEMRNCNSIISSNRETIFHHPHFKKQFQNSIDNKSSVNQFINGLNLEVTNSMFDYEKLQLNNFFKCYPHTSEIDYSSEEVGEYLQFISQANQIIMDNKELPFYIYKSKYNTSFEAMALATQIILKNNGEHINLIHAQLNATQHLDLSLTNIELKISDLSDEMMENLLYVLNACINHPFIKIYFNKQDFDNDRAKSFIDALLNIKTKLKLSFNHCFMENAQMIKILQAPNVLSVFSNIHNVSKRFSHNLDNCSERLTLIARGSRDHKDRIIEINGKNVNMKRPLEIEQALGKYKDMPIESEPDISYKEQVRHSLTVNLDSKKTIILQSLKDEKNMNKDIKIKKVQELSSNLAKEIEDSVLLKLVTNKTSEFAEDINQETSVVLEENRSSKDTKSSELVKSLSDNGKLPESCCRIQ